MSPLRWFLCLLLVSPLMAEDQKKEPLPKNVEQVAEQVRPSVAVITVAGRGGRNEGIGTGFVLSKDGLIATSLHVIGEGREIVVELPGGKKPEVLAIHATDRLRDLAIIRVRADDLSPLDLGDSEKTRDGQEVVAIGNPQGLKNSVVSGVLSGKREIEGVSMLQVAIPVEPGNSGGPLVDMRGRVLGVITLKSRVTENLGFAVGVNHLKAMVSKPNPVPIKNWLTLGNLDPEDWKPEMGARWTQRAGRVQVSGTGSGFGGRSICVSQRNAPEIPFELSVTVKLNDEKGAAGLIFHHDGERHYGFYPTGGKLRLTRFDGPDVFSWKILEETTSENYRTGEWNTLKVRLTKEGFRCYVNDKLAIESKDTELTSGKVGLAKFRDTKAEFREFRVGKSLSSSEPTEEERKVLRKLMAALPTKAISPEKLRELGGKPFAQSLLRERAIELEKQAALLRSTANLVHQEKVFAELTRLLDKPEAEIDLFHAAMMLAKLDNEEIDVESYRSEMERMARKLLGRFPKDADAKKKQEALSKFFFEERGFHGSRSDYYNRSNSYLNEVMDDREGLPISLSVLYMEFGRRIGLEISGVGLPGQFVVRIGKGNFVDVFDQGKNFDEDEAKRRIRLSLDGESNDELLKPMSKKVILVRMLRNLLRVAQEDADAEAGLRYLDGILLLSPESGTERLIRASLRAIRGLKELAQEDVQFLLDHPSADVDPRRVRELKRALEQ